MANLNVIDGAERFKPQNQSERPFYQDEHQFYLFHPPMPTENGKMLQERFDERTEIEKEKISLEEEQRKLVDKFDNLNDELIQVMEKPVDSLEEQMAQKAEIDSIKEKINNVVDELVKVRKKIKEKEKEIDKANEKINEMTEIVIEDEHELNQQQQELEKEKNDKKVELLINQL